MIKELLLSIKKQIHMLIEQTRRRPQETLEFILINEKDTFPFSTSINFTEGGKIY